MVRNLSEVSILNKPPFLGRFFHCLAAAPVSASPEPDHFRIVFLPHEADLREAINRLASFLEKYRKRHGTDKPKAVQQDKAVKAVKAEKAA